MILKEEPTIEIKCSAYKKFKEDSELLEALQCAGVDNWTGWDYAMEILEGEVEL